MGKHYLLVENQVPYKYNVNLLEDANSESTFYEKIDSFYHFHSQQQFLTTTSFQKMTEAICCNNRVTV